VTQSDSHPLDLQELRINRGLSQAQAAREAGVNKNAWSRAERGQRISPANAKAIANFLGYQVTDIWPLKQPDLAEAA
jgi:transcriptional regulator with XRE-family HTH domain